MGKYYEKCHHFDWGGKCRKYTCIFDPDEDGQGDECEVYATSEEEAAENLVQKIDTDYDYVGKDVNVIVINGDIRIEFSVSVEADDSYIAYKL